MEQQKLIAACREAICFIEACKNDAKAQIKNRHADVPAKADIESYNYAIKLLKDALK